MNTRGQYGHVGQGRVHVGSSLLHTLELKQRYDNAKTAAVQILLNDLSSVGVASSVGTNRWEIAMKDGAWVLLTWYPDWSALEITITDRELRPVDQIATVRRRYEEILRKITPRLQSFGATTVGAAIYVGDNGRGERGEYDDWKYGSVYVGLKPFHNPVESDTSVREIDTALNAVFDDMYRAMGIDRTELKAPFPQKEMARVIAKGSVREKEQVAAWMDRVKAAKAKAKQSPHWPFWDSAIAPLQEEWNRFRGEQEYFLLNLFTSWEDYERWLTRIKQLRAEMKSKGIKLNMPDPIDLTKSLPEDVLEAGKKAAKAAWDFGKILKWGVIGALGIGAVVALSSVASNLRSGKDPGEKYMEMIGTRPRPRASHQASRALPEPREQLALPPGEGA